MDRIALDYDLCLFQFLLIDDFLAVRSCSHTLRARYHTSRKALWARVRPTSAQLTTQIIMTPVAHIELLDAAYAPAGELDIPVIFRVVCSRGRLETARWLAARYPTAGTDDAMWMACEGGHLEMAQWLATHFGLTAADIRGRNNNALRMACAGGDLPLVQWLVARFDLKAADVRHFDGDALAWACGSGNLALVQWLVARFGIRAADVQHRDNNALASAIGDGQLEVVNWLVARFGLEASVVHASAHGVEAGRIYGPNYSEVVQWIETHFPASG
jgi:hypothetical protein